MHLTVVELELLLILIRWCLR